MKRQQRYRITALLTFCAWSFLFCGCNTNEVLPELIRTEQDSDELLTISSSEIISDFNASVRQTIQFRTEKLENNIGNLNFYSSHDLEESNTGIVNVIINFHGLGATDQNVKSEHNSILQAATSASASASTIVLSPHFFHEGTGLEFDWENAAWRAGGKASTPTGAALSSSQIVDYFLTEFLLGNDNFPNMINVIIAGHSAGGQFAQRYAAISRIEENFSENNFTYIAANSSHYLYLNEKRWDGASIYTPTGCDTYNDYPYGLSALAADSRYAFISKIGLETIRGNYSNRKVYYVLGDQDITDATSDCESQSQEGGSGTSRYLRGQYFLAYLNDQFPGNMHEFISVSGVGHNANGIYNSAEYVSLLTNLLD